MVKLTERQLTMLRRLLIGGKYHSGVTGASLVRRGLATINQHGCTIITDAGRAALEGE